MSAFNVIAGIYIAYAIAAAIVFRWRPPVQAVLICSFGGWLFLPVAAYPAETITPQNFTVDIIGTALPSNLLVTKALIVPAVVLACLALVAPHRLAKFQPIRLDAAIAGFCLSPLLAWAAGRVPAGVALVQAGYLAGSWGAIWIAGRLFLGNQAGSRSLVTAMIFSGILLLPVSIFEGLQPAGLYGLVFGAHPFQLEGATRYFGFRPLGFFEHGNQYGIWMAMAALAAASRALRTRPRSGLYIAIAAALVAGSIASQSVGAIILLGAGIVWLLLPPPAMRASLAAAGLLLAVGGTAYLSGRVPIQHHAESTELGRKAIAALEATGRKSLGYRVRRDQMALPLIYRAPLAGYGVWDWWRPLKSHPWGLPLLIAGQFGLLALLLAAIALFGGAVRELWRGSRSVLPIIVVMAGIDAWLNSYIYFPAILAAAAMAVPFRRAEGKGKGDDAERETTAGPAPVGERACGN